MAANNPSTKHKHSKFLFFNQDAEPIVFFMRPCAERGSLRSLIEHGGGMMTAKATQNCIKLAMETDQVSKDDYLLSSYITDCVRENKLLDIKDYKMKPKKSSITKTKDFLDATTLDPDIDDMSPADYIQPYSKDSPAKGRMNYSLEDDMEMIKYAVKNCDDRSVKGLLLFKDMAILKITDHSAESMNCRFRKHILLHIDAYDIPNTWKFKLSGDQKYITSPSPKNAKKVQRTNPEQLKGVLPGSQQESCSSLEDSLDMDLFRYAKIVNTDTDLSPGVGTSKISVNSKADVSPSKKVDNKGNDQISTPSKDLSKNSKDTNSSNNSIHNVHDDCFIGGHSLRSSSRKDQAKLNTRKTENVTKQDNLSQNAPHPSPGSSKGKAATSQNSSKTDNITKHSALEQMGGEEEVTTQKEKKKKKDEKRKLEDWKQRQHSPVEEDTDSGPPRKRERLGFVQDLDSLEDYCSQNETQNGNIAQSQTNSEDEDNEEEMKENCERIKEMAHEYDLELNEVLYILWMNDGYFNESRRWIETGRNSIGHVAWDLDDDNLLENDNQTIQAQLIRKYGENRVQNRLEFLERV